MKLPQSLTKITTYSKFIALFLFILLPFAGFYVGTQYQLKKDTQVFTTQLTTLQKENNQTEEDLMLAIEDRGKLLANKKASYSLSEFGISSPLFTNKEISINTYRYKKQTINEKTIIISQEKDPQTTLTATVWEFASLKSTGADNDKPQVIFTGYENYMTRPTSIKDIMVNWKDFYKSKNNINFYTNYGQLPKGNIISNLYFEFYQQYSPAGHPLFVRLSVDNLPIEQNALAVQNAKKLLMQLADTITPH